MNVKSNEIIILLGAGCSVEAGIPASGRMINEIEELLKTDRDWLKFKDLYNHIKSAIYYAAGLHGSFSDDVPYNIETLVVTLYELERNETHPLYPFIATWNSRFSTLAGHGFHCVGDFRRLILQQLKSWVLIDDVDRACYYEGLKRLQSDLNFSLRVFSLNYDLCVEYLETKEFHIESGFAGTGPNKPWNYERFESSVEDEIRPSLYLYKLHGSIDWRRDEKKNVIRLPHTDKIKAEEMELIFGRDFKLEAADPYLFYAYELRRCSFESRLILVIGYGFGDGHINKILAQAIADNPERVIVVVSHSKSQTDEEKLISKISNAMGITDSLNQIRVVSEGAKEFLEKENLTDQLIAYLPAEADTPF